MAGRAPQGVRISGDRTLGRFAVVAARFNEPISKKLADGAVAALEAGGVPGTQIETHWVPGSFELPQAALALARTRRYAGIVGVGVVIRGETPHFDFVAGEAARGLSSVALTTGVGRGLGRPPGRRGRAGGAGDGGVEARAPVAHPWHLSSPGLMGKRRKARELALQLLYQLDVQDEGSPVPHFDEFWSRHPVDVEVREFTEGLVRGTKLHEGKIDELISQYTEHWEIERMAVVDRNILRQGIFELLWGADVPPKVAINEALEVAKKFSTQESSRFLNGILDRIHKELRPAG